MLSLALTLHFLYTGRRECQPDIHQLAVDCIRPAGQAVHQGTQQQQG